MSNIFNAGDSNTSTFNSESKKSRSVGMDKYLNEIKDYPGDYLYSLLKDTNWDKISEGEHWNILKSERINEFFDFKLPFEQTKLDKFTSLQKWEGKISEIFNDKFHAILKDLTNPNNPEEQSEFSFDEIAEDEREFIDEGAIFYWNIGYLDTSSGRKKVSEIRFKRLPLWSQEEINDSKERALRLKESIDWK